MTIQGQNFMSTPHLKDDDNQQLVLPTSTEGLEIIFVSGNKGPPREISSNIYCLWLPLLTYLCETNY